MFGNVVITLIYVNAAYDNFETIFLEVIDNHIPMKKGKAINKPAPFMNQTLKREIYKKKNDI